MLLVIKLNEVSLTDFSIPFAFKKYIIKIRHEEKAFNHLHLLLAYYIYLRDILQIESVMLLNFEGI